MLLWESFHVFCCCCSVVAAVAVCSYICCCLHTSRPIDWLSFAVIAIKEHGTSNGSSETNRLVAVLALVFGNFVVFEETHIVDVVDGAFGFGRIPRYAAFRGCRWCCRWRWDYDCYYYPCWRCRRCNGKGSAQWPSGTATELSATRAVVRPLFLFCKWKRLSTSCRDFVEFSQTCCRHFNKHSTTKWKRRPVEAAQIHTHKWKRFVDRLKRYNIADIFGTGDDPPGKMPAFTPMAVVNVEFDVPYTGAA